ncbi:tetratricopeptide repeat protein [Spirosoma rhododendri]|uniref:Tetratricopeptide repeat protein n=2 Tax=Spirosoma rhododendri TaxID=2728024 RepID=A0A7L5DUL8_9BACT|nr:tetratricopeptide repeat protein [Spirosoma rhododendri]
MSVLAQPANNLTQAIHFLKLAGTLRAVDKSEESIPLIGRALPVLRAQSPYWSAVAYEVLGLAYDDIHKPDEAVHYLEIARSRYGRLKYVASGWAVNEVIRNIAGKNLYAGIQLGADGVRVAIFKTRYESDFYEKNIRSSFYIPNGEPVADLSARLPMTRNALETGLDSIRRYNIPNERIFVVLSSDLRERYNSSPAGRQLLDKQLAQLVPDNRVRIDTTLTAQREAELFTIGAVPRKSWATTSALNIGADATTAGYINQTNPMAPRQFYGTTFNMGINKLVEQVTEQKMTGMIAFRREAEKLVQSITDSTFVPWLRQAPPGLRTRRVVAVGGEAVNALVTCLYPEKAGATAVPITTLDASRFRQLALTNYAQLLRPDLSNIADPVLKAKAESQLRIIRETMNERQTVAAALWLDAVVKAYTVGYGVRQFVFIRDANIGWVTGKFLETINHEYESTIAKGEFYTR